MAESTHSLSELTGPIILHLQSDGAYNGVIRIIANPDVTHPRFIFGPGQNDFKGSTLLTEEGHVYLTLPALFSDTSLIGKNESEFRGGKNSIFSSRRMIGAANQEPGDEQAEDENEFSLTAYLPAESTVIANLRAAIIVFNGPLNEIHTSLLNGEIGVFGPFNHATLHSTQGFLYVAEVPRGSSLMATTGSDDIEVGTYRGSGHLSTVSGDVHIHDADPQPLGEENAAALRIEAMTGDVIYTAAAGAENRIDAASSYGTINGAPATPPSGKSRSQPSSHSHPSAFYHLTHRGRPDQRRRR